MSNYLSSLHTNQNEAATSRYRVLIENIYCTWNSLDNTEAPSYQNQSVCVCVCVRVWEDLSLCSVITQMNTKDTIYTASLLTDIVYYIYFSYRNNVCGSFGRWYWTDGYVPAEDDS